MHSAKRPTLLFGYVGMPVSLLDNQCCVKKGGVTLGAANGVGAIWLKPVVDGEPSVERGAIKYYPRPPLCLFVQLQHPARRCSRLVDGFPDGVVCCRPSNDTIEHSSVVTSPDIAVHRRQIPMMPRFAMTSYKVKAKLCGASLWASLASRTMSCCHVVVRSPNCCSSSLNRSVPTTSTATFPQRSSRITCRCWNVSVALMVSPAINWWHIMPLV